MDAENQVIHAVNARIQQLEEDSKYLLGIVDYYFKRIVPKGLDPTAYVTLTYEGDKEISDRIEAIRGRVG